MHPGARALILLFGFVWVVRPAQAQAWLDARAEIERLEAGGEYASAVELSPDLLALGIEQFGERSQQVAETHLLIGQLQIAVEDFDAAEDSILESIDIYEQTLGELSPSLIAPLMALGDALRGGGAYQLALAAYEEARGISRRADGLFNAEQIDILYRMAASKVAAGDIEEAHRLQIDAVNLIGRLAGGPSRVLVDAVESQADWLNQNGLYEAAGDQYRALASTFSLEPLERVRLLRLASANYRREIAYFDNRVAPSFPDELLTAIGIVEDLPQDLPPLRAELMVELGDWYVIYESKWAIEDPYLVAWEIASGLEDGDRLKSEWFGSTVPLRLASLRSPALGSDEDAVTGHVELRFTVKPNGTADDIQVIAADPPGLIDSAATWRVEDWRFRPAIEDGQFVDTTRTFGFNFLYEAEEQDQALTGDGRESRER